MRDCFFLVADSNMRSAFEGFLTRDKFYLSLGCGPFDFDPAEDILVAAGDNDPGIYTRGHEILRPIRATHKHAVAVLDAEWDGTPGRQVITEQLSSRIESTGWSREGFQVLVIDPELENWIWQRNVNLAHCLRFKSLSNMMDEPDVQRYWPEKELKPRRPKEVLETLLKKQNIRRSSALYRQITSRVSVKDCQDSAFHLLRDTLRRWFPANAGQSSEAAQ
jgi:hypothetical protein